MKTIYLLLVLCILSIATKAQTVLLSNTGAGGFESGTTFAANGWTEVQGSTNKWVISTVAAGRTDGSNGAYMSSGSSNANVNHFYRDLVIPSGATNITLLLKYKMTTIDNTYDYLYIKYTTTANTPVAGTIPTTGYTQLYSNTATAFSSPTTLTYTIPAALAGTTLRLVFTYKCDGASPYGNPCIDFVQVTYTPGASCTGAPTGGSASASVTAACGSYASNITLSGASTGTGVTFQWQSSPDNTTWTNISGATLSSYAATVSAATYYRCVLTCSGSGLNTNSGSALCNAPLTCVNMVSGSTRSLTTCAANFYSTNGASGSYGNSENGVYTFYPGSIDNVVKATFGAFGSESGYDYLYTFNGNSTSAAQIGSAVSGTTIPGPFTSTAADGSLTFQFTSDGSNTASGFSANISCQPMPTYVTRTPTSYNFGTVTAGATATQNIAIVGGSLTSGGSLTFTVSPSSNFLLFNGTSYVSSYTYAYSGTHIYSYNIPVRFSPTATGAYSSTLTISGGGLATAVTVPLSGNGLVVCATPTSQATGLSCSNTIATSTTISFTAASPAVDSYLVVATTAASLSALPVNTTNYAIGAALGGGKVVGKDAAGANTSLITSGLAGLSAATTYNLFMFSYNGIACGGGPVYRTTSPATSSFTTCVPAPAAPTISNVLAGQEQVNWTVIAGATNYTVNLYTNSAGTGTPAFTWTSPSGATTSHLFTGLSNGYYYANLSANTASCSSGGGALTAALIPISLPYWESFETISTQNAIPTQWGATTNAGTSTPKYTDNNTSGTAPYHGSWDYIFVGNNNGNTVANNWLISPGLPLLAGTTYNISFNYNILAGVSSICNLGTPGTGQLSAFISNSGTTPAVSSAAMGGTPTTLLSAAATQGTGWVTPTTMTYTAPSTGSYYLGIRYVANSTCNFFVTFYNSPNAQVDNIRVCAQPAAITSPTATSNPICKNDNLALDVNIPAGYNYYTWLGPNGFSSSNNVGTAGTATVSSIPLAGAGVYTVTAGSDPYNTCSSTTTTASVIVIDLPGTISPATVALCEGATLSLTATGTGGIWSSSDNSIVTVNPTTGVITAVDPGTATITYATGCGTPATRTVTVNAQPGPISGGLAAICTLSTSPAFTNATAGTVSSVWSNAPTTYGSINAATGVFSSNSTVGTTTISYTANYAGGSCYATTSLLVSNATPAAISGATSVCAGLTTALSDATPGGAWSVSPSSVASISAAGVFTGLSQGTATVSYSGCGYVTYNVTVNGYSGTIANNGPLCTGAALTLTDAVAPVPAAYAWAGPSGFSSTLALPTIGSVTTANGGTYSLTLTTGGCTRVFTTAVAVSPLSITLSPTTADICDGGVVPITATIGGAATPATVTQGWEIGVPTTPGTIVDGWNTTATATTWYSQQSSGTHPTITTGHTGTKFCTFNSYALNPGSGLSAAYGALISPSFSMIGMNGTVSFWVYREVGGSYPSGSYLNEGFKIYINTTGSVSGATLLGFVPRTSLGNPTGVAGSAHPGTSGWYQYSVALPATFTGAANYLLFEGVSAYGDDCYLDDVAITTTRASATWSPTADLYTNPSLTAPYFTANNAVYAAPSSSTAYAATIGTCTSSPTAINVMAQPSIVSITPSASVICSGTSITIDAIGAGGAGTPTYTWSGAAITTATTASGTSPIFTPVLAGANNYSVSLSYTGAGCLPAVSSTVVTTNALPVSAPITASSLYCIGSGSVLTLTSSTPVSGAGSVVSYNWSGPDGFSATTAPGVPSVAFTPTSTAATGIYSLSVTYSSGSCTSLPVVSPLVTVGVNPAVHNVTGGTACSATGLAPALDGSDGAAYSYELRRLPATTVAIATGITTTLLFAHQTIAGTYVIIGTGPGSCQALMSGADTISETPGITIGATPNICQPSTSASVAYTTPVGSPSSYNIDWDAAANSAGFSDVAGITLGGSSIALSVPASGAVGSFAGTLTVSNGACISAPYTAAVVVYATPVVPVITVGTPCVNRAGAIDFTGVSGSTIDYTVDGGLLHTFTFTGPVYSLSTGIINTPHTYVIGNAHNPVCVTPVNDTITVTPIPMEWLGGATGHESDWNENTNWTCGFPPTVSDNVAISSTIYAPAIPAFVSTDIKDLVLYAPSTIIMNNGATLNVKGNITNTSTIVGQGRVVLNGSAQQMVKGVGTISNLELDNAAGAAVDTASRLMISNALFITSGVLATNDSLELLSLDTSATARIAPLPNSASIVGRVKTDQYIQGGFRRYRFWSHAFSDTMSLMQLQKFIDITGDSGSVRGFVTTSSNAPSAFRYDPLVSNSSLSYDTGWRAITKIKAGTTDENMLHPGQGMRLFVRGLKGEGLSYAGYYGIYTPSPATVKMIGHVNQGPVSIRLSKGTVDPANQDYNLVGNPYPSPIDIGTIASNALAAHQIAGSAFYLWIASTPGGGQWSIVPIGSPYYIGAHVGFEVRADHDGASLDFVESDKASSIDNYLFKAPTEYTTLSVYDSSNEMWDMLRINFTDAATDNEDKKWDATKPMATNFGFYSISADGRKLGIDARPYAADKVIPLGVHSVYEQQMVIRANSIAVPQGGTIYLHDKLLGKVVAMNTGSEYQFTIGKDKATQGEGRFELSMKPAATMASTELTVSMTPNPATNEVKVSFASGKKESANVRVLDMTGVVIYSQNLGEQQNGTISVPLNTFAAGVYMVEVAQGSQKITQKLVKE